MKGKIRKISHTFRHKLVFLYLLQCLEPIGINIRLFYLVKERASDVKEPEFKDSIKDYSFGFLGSKEIMKIEEPPNRQGEENLFYMFSAS